MRLQMLPRPQGRDLSSLVEQRLLNSMRLNGDEGCEGEGKDSTGCQSSKLGGVVNDNSNGEGAMNWLGVLQEAEGTNELTRGRSHREDQVGRLRDAAVQFSCY